MANETSKRKLNAEEWQALVSAGANLQANIYPTGVSMRPLIRGGRDRVTVEPFKREIMIGDIVLFLRKDGAQVLHRVWKIDERGGTKVITTFGDGCWWPDEPVTEDKILGIATKLYKNGAKDRSKKDFKPLDTASCRKLGLIWLKLGPIRRIWYRTKGVLYSIKKRIK